ncbi:hypothetical protein [Methylibium sp.]|jgi:hypothetical protein|uniref:hypothetical protein n=1 Tax=Methylibium sp. TaxID=2067992 RepID=UPI003D0D1A35
MLPSVIVIHRSEAPRIGARAAPTALYTVSRLSSGHDVRAASAGWYPARALRWLRCGPVCRAGNTAQEPALAAAPVASSDGPFLPDGMPHIEPRLDTTIRDTGAQAAQSAA